MTTRHVCLPLFIFALGLSCHDEPELGPPTSLDPACAEEYQTRASEVLASVAQCESDADCVLANREPGCLTPFLCSKAIAVGNDAAYEDAATQLIDEYIAECGNFCAEADCVGPEQLRAACDTSIGQCVIEDAPSDGASVGD